MLDKNKNPLETFLSYREAEEYTKINFSNIRRAVKRGIKAGGYYWKYGHD